MVLVKVALISCVLGMHLHGGHWSPLNWSKTRIVRFGPDATSTPISTPSINTMPKKTKLCRQRRDLIGWNRQTNHLVRRMRPKNRRHIGWLKEQYRRRLC